MALARHGVAELAAREEVCQGRDMVLEREDIKKEERKEYRVLARRVLTKVASRVEVFQEKDMVLEMEDIFKERRLE